MDFERRINTLRVSSKSNPKHIAEVLCELLGQFGKANMRAVGAAAINQAVKAIAIASLRLVPSGGDIVCIPAFCDVVIDGQTLSAIQFSVEVRWAEEIKLAA